MDERLSSAIAHWAPRFTTQGVTVSDFDRITSGLDGWDGWCAAWSAVAAEHAGLGGNALAAGQRLSAGEHLYRAALYYHFAKFLFVDDLGQMREAHEHAVRCYRDALPYLTPPGQRVEIDFEGAKLVATLRRPETEGPHPAVIMLCGLDSTKEELRTTEETFLARGLATFAVDGPGQGEAEYDLPIRADWSKPGQAILDALRARGGISSVGVWGVSLGGYYAPRVAAALGDQVRACVALGGPYDLGSCWDGLPELTRRAFTVRSRAASEQDAREIAGTLTLAGVAKDLTAPLLIVFGRRDRIFPYQQAERLAATTGGEAELLMLERGNHGCANVAPWHRPYTADWMKEKLS